MALSHPQALYHCDLALACIFSLNWAFWFWIAEDRLRYIFSFLTLVDVVTIVPSFVLYGMGATVAETVPGLNFLRVLRCVGLHARGVGGGLCAGGGQTSMC